MITIELIPEHEAAIEAMAASAGLTAAEFVREAALERLEDAEDLRDAEEAWARFVASGRKTVTLEEVMAKRGLAD